MATDSRAEESSTYLELNLVFERVVDVPPKFVWAAWTEPEYIKKWFAPAPLTTVDSEIDLGADGLFRTVMGSRRGTNIRTRVVLLRSSKIE